MWLVESIVEALISFLAKWLGGRKAASDATKAVTNQAQGEAESGQIRDKADSAVEQAREQNNAALNHALADACGPDGLRKQSADVNAAIAQADSAVR